MGLSLDWGFLQIQPLTVVAGVLCRVSWAIQLCLDIYFKRGVVMVHPFMVHGYMTSYVNLSMAFGFASLLKS